MLSIGARSDAVRNLQRRLEKTDFDPGPIDGIFGDLTRRAVVRFQAAKELEPDGIVGPITADALSIDLPSAEIETERRQFQKLLLQNPNYFGTQPDLDFEPTTEEFQGNTTYEELTCVGYNPRSEHLEAVVEVKRTFGYLGSLCEGGSLQYVRFFVDWDDDGTWTDVGMASARVYDMSGPRPLDYAVTLQVDPDQKFCFTEYLPPVRAILSWNQPPPPGDENHTPVWGNVHESRIQIAPLKFPVLGDVFDIGDLELPAELIDLVDLSQEVSLTPPKTFSLPQAAKAYRDTDVPPHRFAHPHVQSLLVDPGITVDLPSLSNQFPDLNLDPGDLLESLEDTEGDTSYEELTCVGLNANLNTLSGVFTVKQPSGYSGSLCDAGSREYVAFWRWDSNLLQWVHMGTTSVEVHDLQNLPGGGLQYAAFLPVNPAQFRQPCSDGPSIIKIRAILSWEQKPPAGNPNYVPTWGNRLETRVHVKPGAAVDPETHPPVIQTVGGMDPDNINDATGLANGSAETAGFTANDSPFGGRVFITGKIAYPPNISEGATPLKYRIRIRKQGESWQTLHEPDPLTIKRDQLLNGVWTDLPPVDQTPDEDGYYEYLEDLTGGTGSDPQRFVVVNKLAVWDTGGRTGMWQLKVEVKDPDSGTTWNSEVVTVRLDNTAPNASIDITSGGGACADFVVGDKIEGTYEATDEHFSGLSIRHQPVVGGNEGAFTSPAPIPASSDTMPLRRRYTGEAGGVPTNGEFGTWELDTTGMPRCGYIIRLRASDRTIVNSGHVGHGSGDVVGLCLREEGE